MLGGKLGNLVESAFNAQTAGDIMDYTLEQLSIKLGQDPAMLVYSRCRGIDNSPVIDQNEPQSLSTTKNFNRYPVHNLEKLDRWIQMNSMDLWMRVLEEWETRKRWPRSLTISYSTTGNTPKSKTAAFPSRHTHGMQDSPDIVVNAVRVCMAAIAAGEKHTDDDGHAHQHAQQTSPLFPLIGFSLTAKSFQREVANASMMQKWLSKSRVGTDDTASASGSANSQLDSMDQGSGEAIYEGNSANGQQQEHDRQQEPNIQNTFSLRSSKIQTEAHPGGSIKADAWNGNNGVQNQQTFVQAQAQQPWSANQVGYAQDYRAANPNDEYEDYDDYEDEEAESAIYSNSESPSSASTPPPPDHAAHHLYAGSAITAAQYAGHMFGGAGHPMSTMYEADVNTIPPPLDPPRLVQPGADMGSEYDSSDSDMSYLRTPQESGSEEGEEAEEEEGEEDYYEEAEDDEEDDEEMDDGGHDVQETPTEANASISQPEYHIANNGSNYYAGNSNVAQQSHAAEYAQEARSSTSKGKQAVRAEEYDYRPSSRATPASSRPRASVYIQSTVDMDSAARYGEGYKHMDIDKHDDGSLVVATSEEAQSNSDGFMPALISATRRKREIQIFRFQNPVDAPDNAISGLQVNASAKKSSSSRVSSNRHSRNSSAAGSNVAMGESSLMATVRTRLEESEAPIAEEEGSTDDERVNDDDLAPVEGVDLVLDIAVNAMMESMSASQTVMQIRCPQCPGSAPAVSSQEWETHRDWHIARQLQERELRHDQVAQHIQQAFVHVEADRPVVKRARHDGRVVAAPPSSSPSTSPATSKRRQQTIGE
ncbi:N-acetyltransferase eso1, partial [Coemansia sp. RSA 2559]